MVQIVREYSEDLLIVYCDDDTSALSDRHRAGRDPPLGCIGRQASQSLAGLCRTLSGTHLIEYERKT
jgi:hypothetical protein